MKPKIIKALYIISAVFLAFCGVVVLSFLLRIFVYEKYPINTESMSPTIIPGDHVMVNKLLFGARVYKNLDFLKGDSLETWRVKGFRKIKHNDIIAFNFPCAGSDWNSIVFKINYVYIKRCIALPGETISIKNGYYDNESSSVGVGHFKNQQQYSQTPDSLISQPIWKAMPFDDKYDWNTKNFGPLYVPKRGETIRIDSLNYILYKVPIEYETSRKTDFRDGQVMITGGAPFEEYTFKENYYFVGGDNVADSQDSRYFGFVPEEFIVGIVTRVIFSKDNYTNGIRKNRLFKTLE